MQGWNRISSILCQTRAKSESLLSWFSFIQYSFTTCFHLTSYIQIIILIFAKQLIKQELQTSNYKSIIIIPKITLNPSCSVIIYVMTVTNKRLLISESRGDSNQCTPCRGKPDQHDTYASHASARTPGVRFLRAVPVRGNLSRSLQQRWTEPLLPRKKGSRHNPQRAGWPIRGFIPSFSPVPAIEAVGVKPPSVGNQLLGLPGPYHRHAIGTFNTCSRGPTEWSSTNLGGGYNLGGAGLSHTHSPTFPTSCLHFPLMAPPGLHFNQVLATNPKCE
jgi:hypothetical protein